MHKSGFLAILFALVAYPMLMLAQGDGMDTIRLTMADAVSVATAQNLSVQASLAGVEQAKVAKRETWSALMPNISASGTYGRTLKKQVIFMPEGFPFGPVLEVGSDNSFQAGVNATMPLFSMAAYRNIQLGQIRQEAAQEQLRATKLGISAQVKLAFVNLLLAQESAKVMAEGLDRAEKALENITNLNQQGIASDYDVIRARVQVSNLKPNKLKSEQTVQSAILQLKSLLGYKADTPIKIVGNLPELMAEFAREVVAIDAPLTNNSTLKQLDMQQRQLEGQRRLVHAQYYPTLAAFGNFQIQSQANNFDFENYYWAKTSMVGVKLDIPLFSGLQRHFKSQQLKMGIQQVSMQRQYAQQQMSVQIQVIRQRLDAALQSMEASVEGVKAAQKGVEIANTRYSVGAGTILELNDAEMARTQAQLNYNQAVYELVKAHVDYANLIGQE